MQSRVFSSTILATSIGLLWGIFALFSGNTLFETEKVNFSAQLTPAQSEQIYEAQLAHSDHKGQENNGHEGTPFGESESKEESKEKDSDEDESSDEFHHHNLKSLSLDFIIGNSKTARLLATKANIPLYLLFHSWRDFLNK